MNATTARLAELRAARAANLPLTNQHGPITREQHEAELLNIKAIKARRATRAKNRPAYIDPLHDHHPDMFTTKEEHEMNLRNLYARMAERGHTVTVKKCNGWMEVDLTRPA